MRKYCILRIHWSDKYLPDNKIFVLPKKFQKKGKCHQLVCIVAWKVAQIWVINYQNSCQLVYAYWAKKPVKLYYAFSFIFYFSHLLSFYFWLWGNKTTLQNEETFPSLPCLARCLLCCPGIRPISCWSWLARVWRKVETCCFTEDCSHHANWNEY